MITRFSTLAIREGSCKVHRGRDRMVLGFTTTYSISFINTKVVSSNPPHGEVYSIHRYVKFFNGLRQVGGFLQESGTIHQNTHRYM